MNKNTMKEKLSKKGMAVGIAILISSMATGNALAAGWAKNEVGWWYDIGDGTYPVSSWRQIDGSWFCFDENGYIRTGFIYQGSDTYYCKDSGRMITGWYKIGNYWYYFNGSGAMVKSNWIDDCYLLSSGKMATNREIDGYWVGSDGKWDQEYYEEEEEEESEEETERETETEKETERETERETEKETEQETEKETERETEQETEEETETYNGWKKVNGDWYFYQDGVIARNQLCQGSGKWYYVDNSGRILKNTIMSIEGKVYILDVNGIATEKKEASTLSIGGHTRIVSYVKGDKFPLDGVISSNYVISKINIKIYFRGINVYSKTFNPNVNQYDLGEYRINAVDMKNFSATNNSRVVVTAEDEGGAEKTVIDDSFTSSYPEAVRVAISGETIPSTVNLGSNFGLYGVIESNYSIDVVEGKISKGLNGTEAIMRKEAYPNAKTYNLHGPINDALVFERLEKGIYYYTVTVSSNGAEKTIIRRRFVVK